MKRKAMSAEIPDLNSIAEAAGNSTLSIDRLEDEQESAKSWETSNKSEDVSEKPKKQKSREGRVPIQGYFEELTRERLKFLALRDKSTVEKLMDDAFQDYFEKHKAKFKGVPHLEC